MRPHAVLYVFLILFATIQVQGRTITAELAFARMDTCSALPSTYSYSGIGVKKLLKEIPYIPELTDPMKANIELSKTDSLMLVWGKANAEKLSFYMVNNRAKTASEISFELHQSRGHDYYTGTLKIPIDEGLVPKMLLAFRYYPIQKMLMYRRLDFRLGAITVGGRKVKIALTPENKFSFQKTSRGLILIDQDGDGHFQTEGLVDSLGKFRRAESYVISQPFPLSSTAYEITKISSDGYELELTPTKSIVNINIGLHVPDLSIETFDGNTLNLGSLRGNIVVLNWWHIRCSPCIEEMPSLNDLVEKYASDRVIFLAVADNTPAELKEFFKNHKFDYQIALYSDRLREALGRVYPRHIIIDATGVVVYNQTGGSPSIGQKLDTVIAALKVEP